jgi:hypothetical protein
VIRRIVDVDITHIVVLLFHGFVRQCTICGEDIFADSLFPKGKKPSFKGLLSELNSLRLLKASLSLNLPIFLLYLGNDNSRIE